MTLLTVNKMIIVVMIFLIISLYIRGMVRIFKYIRPSFWTCVKFKTGVEGQVVLKVGNVIGSWIFESFCRIFNNTEVIRV